MGMKTAYILAIMYAYLSEFLQLCSLSFNAILVSLLPIQKILTTENQQLYHLPTITQSPALYPGSHVGSISGRFCLVYIPLWSVSGCHSEQ